MRILLLRHDNVTPGSFFHDYLAGIQAAARELGHEAQTFGYAHIGAASAAERDALYRLLAASDVDVVVDPCCWGYALSQSRVWDGSGTGEAVFDSVDAACVGLLCDQPYYQPLPGIHSGRLHAALPDRTHAEQIALLYPALQLRSAPFVPPAARIENDRSLPWAERDIDVLYLGHLQLDALERPWRGSPEAARCDALAERALAAPDTPLHRVLLDMIREDAIDSDDAAPAMMTLWLQRVEYFVRARFRLDAVRAAAAAGVRMHVVGKGWNSIDWPATVSLQEAVSYEDFFRLAGRSRTALDASTYLNGANDRVFNFAVNRCLGITNARGYLGEAFAGGGMRFYSMSRLDELGALIGDALSRPGPLQEEMDTARAEALRSHTWRSRLSTLLEAIRGTA